MPLTVPYKEVKVRDGQSPEYSADEHGDTAVRFLQFEWSDINQATYELMGRNYVDGDTLKRVLPCQHPKKPWLWVSRVSGSEGKASTGYELLPVGDDIDKSATYSKGVLRVEYAPRMYPMLKDDEVEDKSEFYRFVQIEEHYRSSYISGPGTRFLLKWVPDTPNAGVTSQANFGKVRPLGNLTMRWHFVPDEALPFPVARKASGMVNQYDLGTPGTKEYFEAGTLLYLGWKPIPASGHYEGERLWHVEYYFDHDPYSLTQDGKKHVGHNTYFDFRADPIGRYQSSRDGQYYEPGSVTDGKLTYNEFDVEELFRVPE